MPSRRPLALAAIAALLAAGSASALAAPSTHGTPAPGFGTPVVTNPFEPGYEPDVAIDKSAAHRGRTYVSWPNGFSTTISYFLRSDDGLRSFHPIEANTAGKPLSCPGGGDTDTAVNNHDGELFFADLQGLTNFSNAISKDGGHTLTVSCTAVPGSGVDRQWLAVDNNGGSSSVGGGTGDGRTYFTYDNVAQDPGNSVATAADNQLVINESKDGYNYGGGSGCVTPGVNCALPPAVISRSEGIPGNAIVDNTPHGRYEHTVYVPHVDASGSTPTVDWCRGTPNLVRTAASVADACTNPTNFAPGDPQRVNVLWHDTALIHGGKDHLAGFVTMSDDSAGNLYVVWAQYPGTGAPTGPGVVYLATSTDGGVHWSTPTRVSRPSTPTVVFPWVAAGDPGRVDIVWYGAPQASYKGQYGPDTLNDGTWDVYLAQSLNALSAHPAFTVVKADDHQNKYGNISTQGLGGSPDRSLGDFLEIQSGVHGEAVISYVDDTSADRNKDVCLGCGQTPAEAAGPAMIAVQTTGPSLYRKVGTLRGDTRRPYGSVTDPAGDAFVATGGKDLSAPKSLDVTGVSVTQPDASHLRITLRTADPALANHLQVSASLGGPTADWVVRWAAPQYHHAGDGNMFYVGMESTLGGAPAFYTGSTTALETTHAKYFVYGHDHAIPGTIKGSTITWTVPLSLIDSPSRGQGLYSITGFTWVQSGPTVVGPATPQSGNAAAYTPPNLAGASSPLSFVIGRRGAAAAGPGGSRPLQLPTGLPVALTVLVGTAALSAAAVAVRRQPQVRLA